MASIVLWWLAEKGWNGLPVLSSKHPGLEVVMWFQCCSFQIAKQELSSLSRVLYFIECHLLLLCKNQITFQPERDTGDKQHK